MSTTATALDAKEVLIVTLERIAAMYAVSLKYIPADRFESSPMGVARTPLSFTAECVGFNNLAKDVVSGAELNMPSEEEMLAFTASFKTTEAAAAAIQSSTSALVSALREADEVSLSQPATAPWGERTTPFGLATMAAWHMAYHDGQLNYIQALYGDGDIHAHEAIE